MSALELEISVVRVNPRGNWMFFRIRSPGGLFGLGEASHACGFTRASDADDERTAQEARRMFAQLADATKPEQALERLREKEFAAVASAGLLERTVYSALEQALCDLAARTAGLPLVEWLGGRLRAAIPVYANINRACTRRDPADFAERAQVAVAEGFRAVKAAVFDDYPPNGSVAKRLEKLELGLARLRAMRETIGPETALLVDCHGRFDVELSVEVARRLESLELAWFEEPVDPENLEATLSVRRRIRQRMAGGELMFGVGGFEPLCRAGAVHVIMPDVKHCGGLREGRRIAASAASYGVEISPHNPSGPVSMAHSAHWACSTPNCRILEHAWGEVDWRAALLEPPEAFSAGALAVSDRPGLGCDLRLPPEARSLGGLRS